MGAMLTPGDLARAFERNTNILKWQAEGLSHEESLLQLPFRGNCLNWVLGHIATSRDEILDALGGSPVMGSDGDLYMRGSGQLSPDEVGILQLSELLARLELAQGRISAALDNLDDEALAREIEHGGRPRPLSEVIFFRYFHETYHVGQTEILRQLSGKDDQVIR